MHTRCGAPNAPYATIFRRSLTGLALLFSVIMPAQAADYTFPDNLPAGCQRLDNGNYRCGALTLAASDTVTVVGTATVVVTAAMTIGAGAQINAQGPASNLRFQVDGAFTLGAKSTLNADLSSAAAISLGANAIISGRLGTGAGAITIGADTVVKGSISTQAGAIAVGAKVSISDNINTGLGTVGVGAGSSVGGNINTLGGVVTIGADSVIDGFITTGAGVVNIGANVRVGGGIGTGGGAVNIGDASRICGSINTLAGVVTLTTNVKVGGSIGTFGGGITIGRGSAVGGNIHAIAAGVITLTGVDVGGNVKAAVGVITLTDTRVRGTVNTLLRFLSGHGVTSTNSTMNDKNLIIAPACTTGPAYPVSSVAQSFDALETGSNANWSATARKPLYAKLAGVPFQFDIAALDLDGELESAYVASGAIARQVKLELFDDVGAACSANANPVASQTASFGSTLFSGALGRALSGAFNVADAHESLLVRIKECTDSTCEEFTSTAPACSSDRFSVRPSALTLSTTTVVAVAPSPTASQTIRAGADFTLLAKTGTKANYGGVLTLDSTRLTAQLPTDGVNARSGGINGVLTPSTLTANADAVTATYSEVGYLYIGPGAYRDDNFTAVDSVAGDCITSSADNANLADTLVDGKYGCSIGNRAISSLGRFVPDHFSTVISPDDAMPCPLALIATEKACLAAGFVYSGQPFSITVTAHGVGGAPTVNYHGLLARDVTLTAWSAPGSLLAAGPVDSVLSSAAVTSTRFIKGAASARPTYTFPTRYPTAKLAAPSAIHLRAHEDSTAANHVSSVRPASLPSIEGGVTVVSGRIKVDNNYGSELLAVPVMTRIQYWDGMRFINSSTDTKTSFSAGDIVRSNCKLRKQGRSETDPACKNTAAMATAVRMGSIKRGVIQFKLAAPGQGNTGSVDISIDASTAPWLPSTKARIGIGIYKSGPIIYLREMH